MFANLTGCSSCCFISEKTENEQVSVDILKSLENFSPRFVNARNTVNRI